jgi:hypothetical protein
VAGRFQIQARQIPLVEISSLVPHMTQVCGKTSCASISSSFFTPDFRTKLIPVAGSHKGEITVIKT